MATDIGSSSSDSDEAMSLSVEDGKRPLAPAVARAEEAVCVLAGAGVGCSETFRSNLDSVAACRMLLHQRCCEFCCERDISFVGGS